MPPLIRAACPVCGATTRVYDVEPWAWYCVADDAMLVPLRADVGEPPADEPAVVQARGE